MTTTTNHRSHDHANTKAERAACRRRAAAFRTELLADRIHIDACDDCGEPHIAQPAHIGSHGEGQLYAVVCGEYIEHYQASRVIFPA